MCTFLNSFVYISSLYFGLLINFISIYFFGIILVFTLIFYINGVINCNFIIHSIGFGVIYIIFLIFPVPHLITNPGHAICSVNLHVIPLISNHCTSTLSTLTPYIVDSPLNTIKSFLNF